MKSGTLITLAKRTVKVWHLSMSKIRHTEDGGDETGATPEDRAYLFAKLEYRNSSLRRLRVYCST